MEKRVGFGPRFGAFLLDCVVVMVLAIVLGAAVGGMLGMGAGAAVGSAGSEAEGAAAAGAALGGVFGAIAGMMIGVAVFGFLYSLIEAITGASPGKMLLKLKIGTADGHNAPMSTYFTRWAIKNSGTLLSLIALLIATPAIGTLGTIASLVIFVGCFLVLGANKQAIHDMAAKTAVFKKADLV